MTTDLLANNLTIRDAQKYLALNGVDWSLGYIKMQVAFGRIPSMKVFSSRVIPKSALERIVRKHREGGG